MAMKLLTAREQNQSFILRVHLDETKVDANGNPDPTYLREYRFGATPPQGQTRAQYIANCKAEIKRLAQLELDQLATTDPGIPLTGEGQTL